MSTITSLWKSQHQESIKTNELNVAFHQFTSETNGHIRVQQFFEFPRWVQCELLLNQPEEWPIDIQTDFFKRVKENVEWNDEIEDLYAKITRQEDRDNDYDSSEESCCSTFSDRSLNFLQQTAVAQQDRVLDMKNDLKVYKAALEWALQHVPHHVQFPSIEDTEGWNMFLVNLVDLDIKTNSLLSQQHQQQQQQQSQFESQSESQTFYSQPTQQQTQLPT